MVKALVGIKKEFDDFNRPIKSIITDLGLEYNNQYFNRLFYPLNENKKIFRKNDEIFNSALSIADRVIRTLRDIFKRLFVSKNNSNWIDYLPDIEKNNNNTYHPSIKNAPIDVFLGKVKPFFE